MEKKETIIENLLAERKDLGLGHCSNCGHCSASF
ncbi:hypothetical protein HNQ88_005118 [Aureibacter tunicatorum]|uniref:Uncharacterized protein n=1 Tax=Aureibacter tunicatorum TaxID=866807 RepID=A0AAE3XQ82_9BACT|nr:hypothetical protein [Aureibacter tunicatorum]